jgi:uncharacterized protein (TIGR02145 family)
MKAFKMIRISVTVLMLLIFSSGYRVLAEDIIISFTGTGETTSVTSVLAENLTKNISVTLNGNDILRLRNLSTGIDIPGIKAGRSITFSPNPMSDNTLMQFELKRRGNTFILIHDLAGRELLKLERYLDQGINTFRIEGFGKGIYFVTIRNGFESLTGTLLCSDSKGTGYRLNHVESSIANKKDFPVKGSGSEITLDYAPGDVLKLTATSGSLTSVYAFSPLESTTITFDFYTCTDWEGNKYAVSRIGTQLWMAENLKSTKYNTGTQIPNITNGDTWFLHFEPAFAWYDNDINNKSEYGALYNWYAASNAALCPTGWHVPTDTEWTTLTNYLGGSTVAGGKLKEPGLVHWASPNTGASNSSGFTALPGGYRSYDGIFFVKGYAAYFWTSTATTSVSSYRLGLFSSGELIERHYSSLTEGYSIRCIKNQ